MRYFFCFALVAVLFCGCGPSRPKTVPVHGKVTYFGGEWPSPGMLYFAPKESAEGFPLRPASAELAKDGTFTVSSFEEGDGLLPGKYVVTIECWKVAPTMRNPNPSSAVPRKYQSQETSDFIVDVSEDQSSIEITFDVSNNTKSGS
ncbi:MAG: hypothetical protein PVH19_04235 [Planctomycetia bacterium]|jgi:hypothetical protein